MKLYVLTKCSKLNYLNKTIIGIFNYHDGFEKKTMLECDNNNFIYVLEGPFDVNEKPLKYTCVENLMFPEVPNTPLVITNKKKIPTIINN